MGLDGADPGAGWTGRDGDVMRSGVLGSGKAVAVWAVGRNEPWGDGVEMTGGMTRGMDAAFEGRPGISGGRGKAGLAGRSALCIQG